MNSNYYTYLKLQNPFVKLIFKFLYQRSILSQVLLSNKFWVLCGVSCCFEPLKFSERLFWNRSVMFICLFNSHNFRKWMYFLEHKNVFVKLKCLTNKKFEERRWFEACFCEDGEGVLEQVAEAFISNMSWTEYFFLFM